MTWYKFLAPGAVGPFSGHHWPSPGLSPEPAAWVVAEPPFDPCRNGLHLCRPRDLPWWLHQELYVVEAAGATEEHESFVLAGRARLVHRVDAWGRESAYGFGRDCAWRLRDLAAGALRSAGQDHDADLLDGCASLSELARLPGEIGDGAAGPRLVDYAGDAAIYASLAREERGWASSSTTAGYIAAAAARAAAGPDRAADAVADERARQARWIADRVLANH